MSTRSNKRNPPTFSPLSLLHDSIVNVFAHNHLIGVRINCGMHRPARDTVSKGSLIRHAYYRRFKKQSIKTHGIPLPLNLSRQLIYKRYRSRRKPRFRLVNQARFTNNRYPHAILCHILFYISSFATIPNEH